MENNIKLVIGISTDDCPSLEIYAISKALMEDFLDVMTLKTKFLCVRYGNVTWSTGSVLTIWKEMLLKIILLLLAKNM